MPAAAPEREPYSEPSPSAIELVQLCDARFGAKYIARLPDPQGAKAALGTRCHSIAEAYQRDGAAPNRAETFEIIQFGTPKTYYPGRIVQNIVHHLPPAGTTPDVERRMSFVHRGIKFNGRIDWENDATVSDHKFTSNVYGEWVKTPAKLTRDPQRIMYSHDWLERHEFNTVLAQWTYGAFDAKASRTVKVEGERVEIRNLLDEVVMPAAEKILRYVGDNADWNSLPKNTNACGQFPPNGCPYAPKCTRTLKQRVQGVMQSTFLLKLRAKEAAKAPAVETITNDAPSNDVETDEADATAAIVGAINPPGEAADAPLDAPKDMRVDVPKRGRGRPPKAKLPALPPSTVEVSPAEKAASVERLALLEKSMSETNALNYEADRIAVPESLDTKKALVLLIDCVPMRGMPDATFASDLIAQACAHVTKEMDVPDYRLADYGKGQGFLAASIAGLIEDLPAETVVVLDTTGPEGAIALQPFMSAATTVIRGAR